MGDKSPKANQKQASQKKAKNDNENRQRQAAMTARQVPVKKK